MLERFYNLCSKMKNPFFENEYSAFDHLSILLIKMTILSPTKERSTRIKSRDANFLISKNLTVT